MNQAQDTLKSKVNTPKPEKRPKNIILFLADGLSLATTAAARVYAGGNENFNLTYDRFPHTGFSKTYCVDRQVSDSASTATAFLTGVKTNYGTIGVDANVRRYNCEDHANTDIHTKGSLATWAMDAGKSAGLVTTVRVTHATPAPLYAHSSNRGFEDDITMGEYCDPENLEDITEQLIFGEAGKNLKVILGGGRGKFLPNTMVDEEGKLGERGDGKNLIQDWLNVHKDMGQAEYIWNRHQLLNLDVSKTDYLMGLFESNYVKYDYLAREDPMEPRLVDMTEMAIRMLQKEEKGFFLLVEGGRVDTAHHSTYAKTAVDETKSFSDAIGVALRMTNPEETLIVVTADHSHTMTYNGYPDRSNDITRIAEVSESDNLPFTTLSYANGPGFVNMYGAVYGERADVRSHALGAFNHRYYGHYQLSSETHSGEDVGVYANGAHSHLFAGAYEENAIPMLMAYAAKIGPYWEEENAAATISMAISTMIALVMGVVLRNLMY